MTDIQPGAPPGYVPGTSVKLAAPDHDKTVRVQLAWVIVLLAVIAVCALFVAWNFLQLDETINNIRNSFSQLGSSF